MTEHRTLGRWPIVVMVSLVVMLLLASVVLNRFIFRAEQTHSPVFISPSTFRLARGTQGTFEIKSQLPGRVLLTYLQLSITFDPKKLELARVEPALPWQTLTSHTANGTLTWILKVAPGNPSVVAARDDVSFGRVIFTGIGTGVSSISLNANQTILAAVDETQGEAVYNALVSTQDAAGQVVEPGDITTVFPETTRPTNTNLGAANQSSLQKITDSAVLSAPNQALFYASLAYSGKIRVDYGQTPALGSGAETVTASQNPVLFVSSLIENTRYYYRFSAMTDGAPTVGGPLQSFITPVFGSGEISAINSDVLILPARTKSTAQVFAVLRDEDQRVVRANVTVTPTNGQAEIGEVGQTNGIYQATISPGNVQAETISVQIKAGDQVLGSRSVAYDPKLKETVLQAADQGNQIVLGQRTYAVISLALIGLIICGLILSHTVKLW